MAIVLPIQKRSEASPVEVEKGSKVTDSIRSLSTSAGSSASELDPTSPHAWRVKNSFLDSPLHDLTLMQTYMQRRRSASVPALRGRESDERIMAMEVREEELEGSDEEAMEVREDEVEESEEEEKVEVELKRKTVTPPPGNFSAPLALSLADLVRPEYPSLGSELHHTGDCKPCAFFWKPIGCQSGKACQFCHLCDADERKRRNKEKRMAMYAMQHGLDMTPQMSMVFAGFGGA